MTEAPYRIDRLLTQWRLSGALSKVRGIALGRFSRCEPPPNIPSLTLEEVLRDRLSDLDIPIVSNLPFGHDGCSATRAVKQLMQHYQCVEAYWYSWMQTKVFLVVTFVTEFLLCKLNSVKKEYFQLWTMR